MDKESFDALCEALTDAGYEPRKYSGRAMFGRQCLAVHCDGGAAFAFQLCSALLENGEDMDSVRDVVDALADPSEDSMGRGGVIYWSAIPWLGDEPAEDLAVEVHDDEYRSEHGRGPRGFGQWIFDTDTDETITVTGEYPEARKKAVERALAANLDTLYVAP